MMILKGKKIKEVCIDLLFFVCGCAAYAAAAQWLLYPARVSPGGVTGIAAVLFYLTELPMGLSVLVLNIPLLIAGFRGFGGGFIFKTAVSVLFVSFFLELAETFPISLTTDPILSSVFGGLLSGVGLSLVMLRGATTGGADIAVKLINKRRKNLSVGRLFFYIDGFVIALSAVVYRNVETALYSVVAIFVSAKVMDALLYGNQSGRIFFIITRSGEELKNTIMERSGRGVTMIPAVGGYSGGQLNLLLCAVRNSEMNRLRQTVLKSDPTAFFFIASAGDIAGEGFEEPD